jgi:hypothetical protein
MARLLIGRGWAADFGRAEAGRGAGGTICRIIQKAAVRCR